MVGINDYLQILGRGIYPQKSLTHVALKGNTKDQIRHLKIHTWLRGLENKTKEIILTLNNE